MITLTLRVVCGLTTARIARAFVVPEATVAQRITRAKRNIADARIPYCLPDPDELNARPPEVTYLLLNEGYLATTDRSELGADERGLAGGVAGPAVRFTRFAHVRALSDSGLDRRCGRSGPGGMIPSRR
jgi:predicted RNA polymerase sigma factor